MKHSKHGLKVGKPPQRNPQQRKPDKIATGKSRLPRWAVILLCILIAAGGSWALFVGGTWALYEFAILTKVPPELVGKWEVVAPAEQREAIFEFSRHGTMEAHLRNPRTGNMDGMVASVVVEDKRMMFTTRNPNTGRDETNSCIIRELTAVSLVVEFSKGEVFTMVRAH